MSSKFNVTLTNYARGLAQDISASLANFLAPEVVVPAATGQYKSFDDKNVGIVLVAAAGLCALWAQNTGRSVWLWFLFGVILSPIAMIAMLSKNARDRDARRLMDGGDREWRHELLRRAVTGEPDPTRPY